MYSSQLNWTYNSAANEILWNDLCLTNMATMIRVENCTGSISQEWTLQDNQLLHGSAEENVCLEVRHENGPCMGVAPCKEDAWMHRLGVGWIKPILHIHQYDKFTVEGGEIRDGNDLCLDVFWGSRNSDSSEWPMNGSHSVGFLLRDLPAPLSPSTLFLHRCIPIALTVSTVSLCILMLIVTMRRRELRKLVGRHLPVIDTELLLTDSVWEESQHASMYPQIDPWKHADGHFSRP